MEHLVSEYLEGVRRRTYLHINSSDKLTHTKSILDTVRSELGKSFDRLRGLERDLIKLRSEANNFWNADEHTFKCDLLSQKIQNARESVEFMNLCERAAAIDVQRVQEEQYKDLESSINVTTRWAVDSRDRGETRSRTISFVIAMTLSLLAGAAIGFFTFHPGSEEKIHEQSGISTEWLFYEEGRGL